MTFNNSATQSYSPTAPSDITVAYMEWSKLAESVVNDTQFALRWATQDVNGSFSEGNCLCPYSSKKCPFQSITSLTSMSIMLLTIGRYMAWSWALFKAMSYPSARYHSTFRTLKEHFEANIYSASVQTHMYIEFYVKHGEERINRTVSESLQKVLFDQRQVHPDNARLMEWELDDRW